MADAVKQTPTQSAKFEVEHAPFEQSGFDPLSRREFLKAFSVATGFIGAAMSGKSLQDAWNYETLKTTVDHPVVALHKEMTSVIRDERIRLGYPLDQEDRYGLLGLEKSSVTSVPGDKAMKLKYADPRYAEEVLKLLKEAGVEPGDKVAVCASGSLTGVNVALYAALMTIKAQPTIITSGSASQYGANFPDYLWVNMEKTLFDKGLITFRSIAASLGGWRDRAEREDAAQIRAAITKAGLPIIESESVEDGIKKRLDLFGDLSQFKVVINDGGNICAAGPRKDKFYPAGIVRPGDVHLWPYDESVIKHALESGVTVLNFRRGKKMQELFATN